MTSGQDGREPVTHPAQGDTPVPSAERQPKPGIPLGVILVLVIGLALVITLLVVLLAGDRPGRPGRWPFREPFDPLLVISTRTPTPPPIHTPTRTRIVVAAPTRRATPTPVPSSTPTSTPTAASAGETDNPNHTATATSPPELLPTEAPVSPTPMSTPPVPKRPPIPAPTLKEPRVGAEMPYDRVVRFKFIWFRELGPNERVMLYIRSIERPGELVWSARKEDILHGGGRIYDVEEGVLYEINSGFGRVPPGQGAWKVAIVLDTLTDKRQISPWSEERPIARRAP